MLAGIFILNILLELFLVYIIFDFLKAFDRIIYRKKHFYIVGYISFFLSILIGNYIYPSEFLNVLLLLIGTLIIGHFLYNNKKIYMLYYSLYIGFIIIIQIFVKEIFKLMITSKFINFYDPIIAEITLVILMIFLTLIASRIFINIYINKKINSFTKVQFFNFLILPLFSIFYIISLSSNMITLFSATDFIIFIINLISLIALNLFITNIFQSISRNNEMKNKIMLYEQQSNSQYEYYNGLEEKYKSSRKIIHDIKNHIYSIENLYKEGNVDKAHLYKEDLTEIFKSLEIKRYSENRVINIILNDKVEKAKNLGIELNCYIESFNLSFMKDIDLTTIIANLLDNAIDEVKEISEKKEIFFKINIFNNFLVINTKNALRNKPIKINEGFKTTKKNHQGLGLENVKITIEKYDGDLRIEFDENYFKVNIVIPLPME